MKLDPHAEQLAANSIKTKPRLCRRIQNRLLAYLDGDLNAQSRQEVARHLEACAACQYELRLLAYTDQILTTSANGISAPGDLRAGFYARLDRTPRGMNKWRVAVPALAVCGLVLLVSGTVYRVRESSYENAVVAKGPGVNDGRNLAAVTPSATSGSMAGLPNATRAKPMPPVALRPDRQLADNRAAISMMPVTSRRPQTAYIAKRDLAAGFASRRPFVTLKTAQSGRYGHSERLIAAGWGATALLHSRLAAAANPTLSKQRYTQVAMLTRRERGVAALAKREYFGWTRKRQSASGDGNALQAEAINSAANSGKQRNGAYGEQSTPNLSFSNNDLAAAAPVFRYGGSEDAETEGVRFEVKDAQRGFTAGTRSESRMQRQNGRQVLSVHLEDQDASDIGAPEQTQPEQPKIETEKIETEAKPEIGTDN